MVDQGPDRHRDGDLEPWVAVDGVAGVWRFEASERPGAEHWSAGGSRVTIWYLDRDPLAVAAELAPLLSAGWAGRATPPLFAGPFEAITPWVWDWFDPPGAPTRR